MRSVARRFRVSLLTVQRWVARAGTERLDRVDWQDRSHAPHKTTRTSTAIEDRVLAVRTHLKTVSILGEFGAPAIQRALRRDHVAPLPSVTTVGRILERRGALDGQRRLRRPPPPRGWYVPDLAAGRAELDSFDVVEGLALYGGRRVEVLTGISLFGGLCAAWPQPAVTAHSVVEHLITHWRTFGCPRYAQFDNDTCFQGAHQHRDSISRVMRLCLSLAIVPVFTPVRELGFQALIEHFNGLWQTKVWQRFRFEDYADLAHHSAAYVDAHRRQRANRIAQIPRRPVPRTWAFELQAPPRGRIVYLRRTTETGAVSFLGRTFPVDTHWAHRLVRCEVDLDHHRIDFYALRRRDPGHHPLLGTTDYDAPTRRFVE